MNDDLHLIAHHEMGHALVAVLNGWAVTRVAITNELQQVEAQQPKYSGKYSSILTALWSLADSDEEKWKVAPSELGTAVDQGPDNLDEMTHEACQIISYILAGFAAESWFRDDFDPSHCLTTMDPQVPRDGNKIFHAITKLNKRLQANDLLQKCWDSLRALFLDHECRLWMDGATQHLIEKSDCGPEIMTITQLGSWSDKYKFKHVTGKF